MDQAKLSPYQVENIKAMIKGGDKFSFDTNYLIAIANLGPEGNRILKSLITVSFKTFEISNSVIRELQGKIMNNVFNNQVTNYLSNFLTAYLRKKGQQKKNEETDHQQKPSEGSADKVKAFLEPLIELIPRKLVTDAITEFYLEIRDDIQNDVLFYNKLEMLPRKIAFKFDSLLKKYGIANIITARERAEYLLAAETIRKRIVSVILENRNNKALIEEELGLMKTKSYEKDVKIASAAIAHHEKLFTKDSDVLFLKKIWEIFSRKLELEQALLNPQPS